MRLALVVALLAACDRSADEPAPLPPPVEPPAPQKLTPAKQEKRLYYEPYTVGVDAAADPLPPAAPGELDAERGKLVVADLDELCGDIWCEGAYNWKFASITCVRGACKLAFEAKNHETETVYTDTLKFDFFGRAFDEDGTTEKFRRAIGDAIRVWERKKR